MRLKKRVEALESNLLRDPVILYFEDGSTREMPSGQGLMGLLHAVLRGTDLTPGQTEQVAWIRESVGAREPGGGHLIELVRCLSPAKAVHNTAYDECDR